MSPDSSHAGSQLSLLDLLLLGGRRQTSQDHGLAEKVGGNAATKARQAATSLLDGDVGQGWWGQRHE